MSDKNEEERLADGWILCKSKSNPGRKYYFNRKTGKSSWTKPQAEEKSQNNKQKGKKEKIRVEKATQEEQKKSLKRKSDSHEINPSQKKPKQETPTPEYKRKPSQSNKHETPVRYPDSHKKKKASPLPPTPKQTPTKNLANARLSMLRAQLNSEIDSKPETDKSPVKSKNKMNPNTPEAKVAKMDLRSPNSIETKSSTTQSPGSDSLQSTPSPSQFLTANKIIYSMKAQLPEEYCNKQMPKDTFADIEQGICNQTPEFPSTKHPATPPQFSEASKLVSAIKSKLSYKVQSTKDVTMKQYSSAKERMEAFRANISEDNIDPNETLSDCSLSKIELPKPRTAEAMDIEDYKEVTLNSSSCTKATVEVKDNVVLVVDTNIFIHELDVIKMVINSHIKGYSEQPTLLVPWRVINELDRLKDNNNGNGAICKRARAAMDYLYKSLPENSRIKGQSLRDSHSHIYPCESPDDEILNCCLQQAERGNNVMLISNDKNLCNKAVMNHVKCIALNELKPLLENKPQPTADPDLYASFHHYKDHMYSLLATILENEMRAKYDNLWQHVIFRPPPWTLGDVLQCILKHWIAVFNEVFPRIEFVITDLKNSLFAIDNKDPKSLSQSEVTNFKDLCLEIARKCQIIPEYMELAKATLERLTRPPEPTGGGAGPGEGMGGPVAGAGGPGAEAGAGGPGAGAVAGGPGVEAGGGQMPIIESFERLWIVFSSYSAKISTALGIPHNVEDRIPGEDGLQLLSGRWSLFSRHVHAITVALESVAQCPSSPTAEEAVAALAAAFRDSLALVGLDAASVTQQSVRLFADHCRNMIQEAYAKFANLTNLLRLCENNLANN